MSKKERWIVPSCKILSKAVFALHRSDFGDGASGERHDIQDCRALLLSFAAQTLIVAPLRLDLLATCGF